MTVDDVLLRAEGLHKHYGSLHVLRGIDLTVRRGEVVVVIGPSGSGKSSLLRCLNRLEDPSAGHIYIDGIDIVAGHARPMPIQHAISNGFGFGGVNASAIFRRIG